MKRIFSIFAVVFLVVALAVPAFATETDELPDMLAVRNYNYTYHSAIDVGVYVEAHNLPNELWNYDHVIICQVDSTYKLYAWNGFVDFQYSQVGASLRFVFYTSVDNSFVCADLNPDGSWTTLKTQTTSTGIISYFLVMQDKLFWSLNDFGVVKLHTGEEVEIYGDLNYDRFVIPECDGSTCAATDINFDDICDECGMPLAYNLRQTPDSYEVIIKHSDDLTLLHRFTETIDGTAFGAVYDDERITISFDNPVNHYQFKLVNGEWEDYASYPNIYDYHTISLPSTATIESSDLIVYDTSGNVFFQNPLWKMILGLTQGEMTTAAQAVVGTMRVLVLCGVGLIVLLVVLKLFGKRSLLYRG